MAKDESVTFRLPNDLKAQLAEIAEETDRSLSNAVMWLLRRGIDAYHSDGVLVDTRPRGDVAAIYKHEEEGGSQVGERETRPAAASIPSTIPRNSLIPNGGRKIGKKGGKKGKK